MTSEQEELEVEKSPWIWKAAIVALPVGLALSAAIAVGLKVSRGPQTGMEGLRYSANDFDVANLRDAANKAEGLIGARDFESEQGQKSMQQMISFITGSLSSLNLGYQVQSDEGEVSGGRIWKNYWIDSKDKGSEGSLVVWCSYSDAEESASVAGLLSVAEWMRGRSFERRVRIVFARDGQSLASVTGDLSENEAEIHFRVSGLGGGGRGLLRTGGLTKAATQRGFYHLEGKGGERSASDWKMTAGWEAFEEQVRALCAAISEEAGEKVVFNE